MNLIINQKSVRKIPSQLTASGAENSRLIVPVDRKIDSLEKYGLNGLINPGDQILPKGIGSATTRNLTGRVIVHRDLPKVWHHYSRLWGRNQFCGRGETEWVEDYIYYQKLRYPRTELDAENVEISLLENEEGEYFFASDILFHANEERWLTAANIFLEIFGFCHVVDPSNIKCALSVSRRVNWLLLAPGRKASSSELAARVACLRNPTHRHRATRSLGIIQKYGQSQIVVGEGGFDGYVAFRFDKRGFTILESLHPNNATYILGSDWESISQMTKMEVLYGNHHLARIFHGNNWESQLDDWFLKHAA